MYKVEFTPAASREFRKLNAALRTAIQLDLAKLKLDPRPRGAMKLESSGNLYRIRIGPGRNYRAIYEIHDGRLLVLVLKIGDRKDVYRNIH